MTLQQRTSNAHTRAHNRVRTEIVPSNPLKADPTRTATLRRLFQSEFTKRFNKLKGKILNLIVNEDAFGLKQQQNPFIRNENGAVFPILDIGGSVLYQQETTEYSKSLRNSETKRADNENQWSGQAQTNNAFTVNTRWRFNTSSQKVASFNTWIKEQTDSIILENATAETLDNAYWNRYIEDGYKKGAGRAFDDTRKLGAQTNLDFFQGTRDEFLRQSFAQPVALDKVKLLAGRVLTELQGVTEATAQRLTRELTDGLVQGKNPREIARSINKGIDAIGKRRSILIARTEIIRAHAEGQLDALEGLGVKEVGVAVEWSTAGDARVCKLCQPMDDTVFKIKEARGLIPRHPQCRCAFLPANVGESTVGQQRSKTDVDKSISKSLKAEIPKRSKRTIAEQKVVSPWVGADKTIDKRRPKSVLDPTKQGKFAPKKTTPLVPKTKPIAPKPKPKPIAPKPKLVPQVPKPKPIIPKNLPIEKRIAQNQEIKEIRRKVIASEVDAEKLGQINKQAILETKKIKLEMSKLNDRGAELHIDFTQGKITKAELDLESARILQIFKELDVKKAKIKFGGYLFEDAKKNLEDALNVSVKDRVRLKIKNPKPIHTKGIQNEWLKTRTQSSLYRSKAKKANQFITQITKSPKKITFDSHQLRANSKRAFHRSGDSMHSGIFLNENANVKTFIHEIGHRLESEIPNAEKLANEFREMRIARAKTKDVKMANLFPKYGYGADEIGNQDDFAKLFGEHHAYYVGKNYGSGHTEIISMGLEKLFENPLGMAKTDPEYFDFIIGLLRGIL